MDAALLVADVLMDVAVLVVGAGAFWEVGGTVVAGGFWEVGGTVVVGGLEPPGTTDVGA